MTPLQESIEIWTDRAIEVENRSICPLCSVYRCGTGNNEAELCPVEVKTGKGDCDGTPYYKWSKAKKGSYEETKAAKAELEFLKSLKEPE